MMGWSPDHKRMKETFSPILSAAEKRHMHRVWTEPCFGCGALGSEAHHLMLPFPEKRWRRDHRFRLPVCPACHRGSQGIHGLGNEKKWLASIGKTTADAIAHVLWLWAESEAEEKRKAA